MDTLLHSPLIFLLSIGLLSCASSGQTSGQTSESDHSSDLLVVSKISGPIGDLTAYSLLEQYRPLWLQKPPGAQRLGSSAESEPQIQVYINNSGGNAGSISALRRINANDISEIKHFSASEAQFRFGMNNSAGAILVRLKRGS